VHLPEPLARAKEAAETAAASDLLRQAREIQACTLQALKLGQESGDTRAILAAVREARGNLALLSRVLGAIESVPQASVLLSSDWLETRAAIVEALAPYPEARLAVANRLRVLEAVRISSPPPGA